MLGILVDWINKRAEEKKARRTAFDRVQIRAMYPRRKLRMLHQQMLKEEIKQRLADEMPQSDDPYIIMRDAQVGRYSGWSNYLEKEKNISKYI